MLLHRKLKFSILLLLLYLILPAYSQNKRPKAFNNVLIGQIIDNNDKQPLPYTSISIWNQQQKLVTGGISNEHGKFNISVPTGTFTIEVNFMGYKSLKKQNIIVTNNEKTKKLGKILMQVDASVIDQIVVTEEKEIFEHKIDSKTFNVNKDITMKSKNALEALAQIPSVSIDMDDNISLRGNTNVQILINDRPISATSENQSELLEQIQANNIETIDVITNPSAKYNPEGMSGIINIKLKKQQPSGKNLSVNLSSNFINSHSLNISGGVRTKKINLFATYGYRNSEDKFERKSLQHTFFPDTTYYKRQFAEGTNESLSHMGTIGIDYYLSSKTTIGFETFLSSGRRTNNSPYHTEFSNMSDNIIFRSQRDGSTDGHRIKYDISLSLKHQFNKPQHYIKLDISKSGHDSKKDESFFEWENFLSNGDTIALEQSKQTKNNQIYNYLAQYHYPLSKPDRTIEFGFDGIIRDIKSDINMQAFSLSSLKYENDKFRSSNYKYFDQTHAFYSLYNDKFNKFSYQLGLRLEYRAYEFDIENTTQDSTSNGTFNYYPSLHTNYDIDESSQLGFSYSKRVHRPSIWSINPIRNYSNPYSYRVGNPNLKPENIHSTELNYTKKIGNFRLMPSLYYKYTTDVISRVSRIDSKQVNAVTFENLIESSSTGMEMIINYKPTKWINITANGNIAYSILSGIDKDAPKSKDFIWFSRISSFISIPWDIKLQVSYMYFGKRITPQGYIYPMQSFELGLRKSFWKNRATFSIRASDIFRNQKFKIHIDETYYTSEFEFKHIRPILNFSFTYQIGKKNQKRKTKTRNMDSGDNEMGM